ncbi:MAG TPA: serine hydrolase domain-containing protein [Methylovirgula sp.]|jgi:CubicO group peptidase (beta-lactamase class C family)|nr:serine hydrolase domain-containing protein [Methylovirgula sp.]
MAEKWLAAAVDYVSHWIEYQMRISRLPGYALAVSHKGALLLDETRGYSDAARGIPLDGAHRFRVASHSKSFTAAGIMKLREVGKLRLDDPLGQYLSSLHPAVSEITIAQLLSHGAGLSRDGGDSGQWHDLRDFLSAAELREELAHGPIIETALRFKYSNLGYGLLGLLIEAVTGVSYGQYIRRDIIEPAGLCETEPDSAGGLRLASGHSSLQPLGRRMTIPNEQPTNALAAATGFVSTARDLSRFFGQLDPGAETSVLTVASRREMIHRRWTDPSTAMERHYGFGLMGGGADTWRWFGHIGAFQGCMSRTVVLPAIGVTVSLITNAIDGPAFAWIDSIIHILRSFQSHGAPMDSIIDWKGRWWSLWGVVDFVPAGEKILITSPSTLSPFLDATEFTPTGKDSGRITRANGLAYYGEDVHRQRNTAGDVEAINYAGNTLLPERIFAAELAARYELPRPVALDRAS